MSQSFGSNISWSIADGVMTVSGEGKISTPSWDASVWNSRDEVTSIIIQEGITSIPALSFQEYAFVESVTFPSTIQYVGSRAFMNCYRLAEMKNLPEDRRIIEKDAFLNCANTDIQIELRDGKASYRPYDQLIGEHNEATVTDEMVRIMGGLPYGQQLECYTALVSDKADYRHPSPKKFNEDAAKAIIVKDGIVVGVVFDTHLGESVLLNSGNWECVKYRPAAFRFLHDDIVPCRWACMKFE